MKLTPLVFLPALLPAFALAGTVFFTDSQHLPTNLPPDVPVVLLDGPDRLQADMFGELPADPQQAEAQVRQIMTSPAWQQKQLQLNDSYRQVVRAWELGIKKCRLWYLMTAMWCTAPRMWPWPLPCVTGEVVSEYKTFPHQNHGVLAGGCHGTGYGNRAGSYCST